jgi:deoxyribodipyrimidine photolyase
MFAINFQASRSTLEGFLMIGVIWFREDLRIGDNKALYFAAKQCRSGIVGIYIIDRMFLKKHNVAACRIDFTLRGLEVLSKELGNLNIPLLIVEIDDTDLTAVTLAKVMQQCGAQALFFNRQYEVAAPYFRVFNPLRQGIRFDPDAVFIRQFCPELKHLTAKQIHTESPRPIVDLDKTRRSFIANYKKIL